MSDVLVAHGPPDVNGLIAATRDVQLSSTEGQQSINTTLDITGLEALLQALGAPIPIPSHPTADVLNKPLDIGRVYLANILQKLIDCDATTAYNAIQQPASPDDGDLDIVVPRLGKGSDSSVAFGIIERFPNSSIFDLPFLDTIHLRVGFKSTVLPRLLFPYINDRKDSYGRYTFGFRDPTNPESGRKKVVVEFSSPKVSSCFQVKYLRSTVLGAFIANLYEKMGWDVIKMNYLGDWGKPVGLLGVGWERGGSEEQFKADPVSHLLDVNRQINEQFAPEEAAVKKEKHKKKRRDSNEPADMEAHGLHAARNAFCRRLENGEERALAFSKRVRDVNIEYYTKQYARLNVSFDEYSGESQVQQESMAKVEEILKSKGLCEERDGAWAIDLNKHTGRPGMAIIRDRTGSTTYLLRELAAVLDREQKYSFDKMIYVVAADHTVHFSRLVTVLELMGQTDLANKLQHVSFSENSQFSEKVGPADTLDKIIDQFKNGVAAAIQANPDKATILGKDDLAVEALLIQELSLKRATDHAFDVDRMTSFERGTGLYLQWWYSKLGSVLEANASVDSNDVLEIEDLNLLRILAQYPEVTLAAYTNLEPAGISMYLMNVVEQLSRCLEAIEEENQISGAQKALFGAARIVLENGMGMLGIV